MGRLTEAQIAQFKTEGVLVAEGVLDDTDLAPVIEGYSKIVMPYRHCDRRGNPSACT